MEKLPKKIPYSIANFEKIRKDAYMYVDKTRFIPELEKNPILMYLRPRRFGKSLLISMLEHYYDVNRTDDFDALFDGLYIGKKPTINKNNYYIMRFGFSGIPTATPEMIFNEFAHSVRGSLETFVSRYKLSIDFDRSKAPAGMLREVLWKFQELNKSHKIYILIDEYDHFANAVLNNGLTDFLTLVERGGIVRSFYEIVKEYTEHGIVERFFMTGIMSVTLDSMTSGFNIPINITTDERFSDMVGFNEQELKQLLADDFRTTVEAPHDLIQLSEKEQNEIYEVFRENYNGYHFTEVAPITVFNSTLINYYLNHLFTKKRAPFDLLDENLNQSGTTIRNLAHLKNRDDNYKVIEQIVKEKVVIGELSKKLDLATTYTRNDFITLLYNIGMLTIKASGRRLRFEMPNKIIEGIYYDYLR